MSRRERLTWLVLAAALGGGGLGCGGGLGPDTIRGAEPGPTRGDDDDDLGHGDGDADADADEPEAESCDGFDNDRNGAVDEGCGCEEAAVQECWAGDPALAGVGACTMGSQTCAASFEFGEWGACEGAASPVDETCGDGIDQDCDGEVDEGCACAAGETRACFPGARELVGVGICEAGTEACALGGDDAWGDCEGAVLPAAEVCGDGVDQDCDGADVECLGP
jgi:hypothetical protein